MANIEGLEQFTQHLLAKGLIQEDLEFIDFANDILTDFMRLEPSEYVPLGEMHKSPLGPRHRTRPGSWTWS